MRGVFKRSHRRPQETDRREAWQERIGAAPRRDESWQSRQPDGSAGFERQVEPAAVEIISTYDRIIGSGDARILQAKVQPIAGHGLELGAEARPDEVAQQAPSGFVQNTSARPIIGRSIGYATPNKTPTVIRDPLHDLAASRVAPPDMGSIGTAAFAIIVEIRLARFWIRRIRGQCQRRAITPAATQVGGDDLAQGRNTWWACKCPALVRKAL